MAKFNISKYDYPASARFYKMYLIDSGEKGMKKMKRMSYIKILLMAMMIALVVTSASAMPVTSIPGGTIIPMPIANYQGLGPQAFGSGITWSSTHIYADFGLTGRYGYANNGDWDGNLGPMAGLNSETGTMTFAFSSPVKGVGGFINYAPGYSSNPTIAVYDAGMNLIEPVTTLTFHTDGSPNSGEFHGFLESSPEISYFRLSDSYIGITKLTTIGEASPISTPEFPSAFLPATMIIGFLGAVLLIQRTREH